jgi:hypothetical protein
MTGINYETALVRALSFACHTHTAAFLSTPPVTAMQLATAWAERRAIPGQNLYLTVRMVISLLTVYTCM